MRSKIRGGIDLNLVNAQQARRILDRLVGFELSPVLWKKIKPSLSAGRVQSVAVRLIVEREREIMAFESKAYYRVVADFFCHGRRRQTGRFQGRSSSRRLDTEQQALDLLEKCKATTFTVLGVERKPSKKSPAAPFTTSTLQQEAGRKLGMSVSQTMSVAQRLYEAGYITYMRTDSVNLSSQAIAAAKAEIVQLFGNGIPRRATIRPSRKGLRRPTRRSVRPTWTGPASKVRRPRNGCTT